MSMEGGRVRLAYLVSHPIQYQAPLLRRIAQEPDIDLMVLFGSDFSVRGYKDQGFGVQVSWDVPLLEGYRYRVLPAIRDNGTVSATTPLSRSLLGALRQADGSAAFDILWVHGYASANTLRAMLAARVLGIPVLLRAESWAGDRPRAAWKRAAKRLFFPFLRQFVHAALPIGSRNADYWRENLGPDLPQFQVPYAVDNRFFSMRTREASARLDDLRVSLGLQADRPVILFASKLQARKHADHLIEALRLLSLGPAPPPYLVIVGDGEERANLEKLAMSYQLESVRFAGFRNQSELPAFFALADVFVLPSRHEPWGLIVNEAMAAACPVVVSSDVGAGPDLITNGVEGYVYPVGDIAALASALRSVLASPETAQRMGQAAASRVAGWDFEADVVGLRRAIAALTRKVHA